MGVLVLQDYKLRCFLKDWQRTLKLRLTVVLIYLLGRRRVGPFALNYSMGTLTKDPGTPAPDSYKFLHPSSERPGM